MAGLPGITATLPLMALALAAPAGVIAAERPPAEVEAAARISQAEPAQVERAPAEQTTAEQAPAAASLAQGQLEPSETPDGPADSPAGATQEGPAESSEGSTESPDGGDGFPMPADALPADAAPMPAEGAAPGFPQGSTEVPADPSEPRVLISEVVIEGLENHPERERLELAAYAAMATTPGSRVTRSELQTDLSAIYASGWFSDVRIQPVDGPLGVRVVVLVTANPVLEKVTIEPTTAKLPAAVVQDTFAADYGKTLNLNTLQGRMQDLQKWYADQGYSLARITGPGRVSPEGVVELMVREGSVGGVEVQFLNKEGSATNDKGEPIRGKTKPWVVTREISLKQGDVFNRRNLEDDIKRIYATGLFSDVKVTLKPVPAEPGEVVIVLGIVEQSTGSLSGGLGYSQSQGVFGQIQVQDSNLFGRAWDLAFNFTYGQFGGLADISFTDPWIKGDKYRTAFRGRVFISRDVPQVFQSQNNGNIFSVRDFYEAPGTKVAYNIDSRNNPQGKTFDSVNDAENADPRTSWFDYSGNTVLIQRIGGNLQVIRPLNGGNPFKRAPWSVVLGLNIQEVSPINFSGDSRVFGVAQQSLQNNNSKAPTDDIICLSYNCANQNQLVGVRVAATMNNLNDPRNPTSGNFLSLASEQFFSVGPDSPTFNRVRASYTHFIPVNWLKLYKGCRPKAGETADCKQALAFQFSAGSNIGQLPPYEAFCVGGSNSVRGYYDCDLGVGRSFGEATIEYRFPIFSIISGELFVDGGTTFGSQANVPGNPGGLLGKPGSGFSVGTGLIVTTPVGPLRLEVASQDFTGDWRFNLGVGWKF